MSEAAFEAGQQVRLKHDPGRVGVVTNRTRARGVIRRLQVRFADGAQYVPEDQLEGIGSEDDDALDLLKRGRLGDAADLRRAVTHARLTGRIADVIYSMDTTGTGRAARRDGSASGGSVYSMPRPEPPHATIRLGLWTACSGRRTAGASG